MMARTSDRDTTIMPSTLDVLQAQVLSLPKADRARLLDRLVASLGADADAELQWDRLAQERDDEIESGAAAPVAFEEAMDRLRARFPG